MSLRRMRDVLGRSIGLEQRGNSLHVVLVDPVRAPSGNQPASLSELRAELRERLVVHELDPEAPPMRHLLFLHNKLGEKGWPAVEALSRKVIGRMLLEAELLDSQEPSPLLTTIIERLRAIQVAADLREDRESQLLDLEALEPASDLARFEAPEVSETSFEEFEAMERSWAGTIPAELRAPPA